MPNPTKYRVVTECSSKDDAEIDDHGRQILVETNNYQTAMKEAIEWAAYDDIVVHVVNRWNAWKFTCRGYDEATTRYPKTAAAV